MNRLLLGLDNVLAADIQKSSTSVDEARSQSDELMQSLAKVNDNLVTMASISSAVMKFEDGWCTQITGAVNDLKKQILDAISSISPKGGGTVQKTGNFEWRHFLSWVKATPMALGAGFQGRRVEGTDRYVFRCGQRSCEAYLYNGEILIKDVGKSDKDGSYITDFPCFVTTIQLFLDRSAVA